MRKTRKLILLTAIFMLYEYTAWGVLLLAALFILENLSFLTFLLDIMLYLSLIFLSKLLIPSPKAWGISIPFQISAYLIVYLIAKDFYLVCIVGYIAVKWFNLSGLDQTERFVLFLVDVFALQALGLLCKAIQNRKKRKIGKNSSKTTAELQNGSSTHNAG